MYVDAQTLLSDAQALSATAYSSNTYDSGAAANDISVGGGLAVVFQIDVAADATSGDETYQFAVVQSANANLSSHDVIIATDTSYITRSTLAAGYKFYLPLPPGLKSKRYLGVRYILGGTTPSVTVTSYIAPMSMLQNDVVYPDGLTIS